MEKYLAYAGLGIMLAFGVLVFGADLAGVYYRHKAEKEYWVVWEYFKRLRERLRRAEEFDREEVLKDMESLLLRAGEVDERARRHFLVFAPTLKETINLELLHWRSPTEYVARATTYR